MDFLKSTLSDGIIQAALNKLGYSKLSIGDVRDSCYAYLCERPVKDAQLAPFSKALEDGGIHDNICAFEALNELYLQNLLCGIDVFAGKRGGVV